MGGLEETQATAVVENSSKRRKEDDFTKEMVEARHTKLWVMLC